MIITIVCDVYGEETNGTIIAEMNLIRYLKSKGHTVRILCGDQSKIGEENFYVCPNYNFGKLINNYCKNVGVTLTKPDKEVIRKALEGADHVHLMVPLSLSMATIKIAKELNIPTTAGFHMQAENLTSHLKLNKSKLANHAVYKYIYNHLYKYVDGIHYPTEFIKNIFESHIKKQTPAYVISNGVHSYVQKQKIKKPKEYKDKYVILTTGRYAREKCQDTLIKAIKYSKYAYKIQLILGGKGPLENKYKKMAKNLINPPIFKLFSRTEIIDVLNYADMYVHPAQFELEGIACIEAITCGKLTIVSDSKLSATKYFAIDEKCIFKVRNPKNLAKTIDYWIEHPEEAEEYEKKYLNSANNFNQELCMQKMEEMIIEVGQKHAKKED